MGGSLGGGGNPGLDNTVRIWADKEKTNFLRIYIKCSKM
jgi:hypothetical protein